MDDNGSTSPSYLSRSSSLRSSGSIGSRTSLIRRNQNVSARQIRFYRNGDRYFAGLLLAVSQAVYKEFDSLLAELSRKLNLATGAVRFIFNSENGSIVTDVSQLFSGISYVCSSTNILRQLEGGYGKHMSTWSVITKSKDKEQCKSNILNNVENINNIEFRNESTRDFIKPKLVTVIRNGKPPQKKVTLLLNNKTAISLNQVLDQLSAKGSLGKVDKLCSVDGRAIVTLKDMFGNDTVFIALSANEKFPEEGIEWDPNTYRITPYKELKRPCETNMRRVNSMRVRKVKDENEHESHNFSFQPRVRRNTQSSNKYTPTRPASAKIARPRSVVSRKIEQNKDELYPASPFESGDSGSDCEHERCSTFGIKKDKQRLHSNYRIGKIIGDGNFAIVRESTHRKSLKSYALKIINKAKVKGKEHMIESEIHILRKILHPNIVKLHEEFETMKEIYLVMELVSGGDLFDAIVSNTNFSEPDAAYMIRDLASAVKYLHELSIVHRDIKPENLLVVNRKDGRRSLKLADFGLSVEVDAPMYLVCGTPTYVAPEILDESGYGLKVDVWAIGVITYIMLCGFPPFRSPNHDQEELFDKILRADYEYLTPFWDEIDDAPRDLIDSLLVVDASERFDAEDVLHHFWIKKWIEPIEKIQRELSEAEELNLKSRKRLCGIALKIQGNMRKNQSYISSSLLTSPIEESLAEDDDVNHSTCRKLSKPCEQERGPFYSISDDEEQMDDDPGSLILRGVSNPRARPVSFPYGFDYRPADI